MYFSCASQDRHAVAELPNLVTFLLEHRHHILVTTEGPCLVRSTALEVLDMRLNQHKTFAKILGPLELLRMEVNFSRYRLELIIPDPTILDMIVMVIEPAGLVERNPLKILSAFAAGRSYVGVSSKNLLAVMIPDDG